MPYYSKKFKSKKKSNYVKRRKFRKKYGKNRYNAIKTYVNNPFPNSIMTKQLTSQSGGQLDQLNLAIPTYYTTCNFNATSPWTAGGLTNESVMYHRIYRNYYQQWRAVYALLKIQVQNIGPSDCKVVAGISDDANTAIAMSGSGTPPINYVNIDEAGMIPWNRSAVLENDGGSRYNRKTFYFKVNLTKWAKRNNLNQQDTVGSGNAQPAKYPIAYVGLASLDNTTQATCLINQQMVLYNKYFDRKDADIARVQ